MKLPDCTRRRWDRLSTREELFEVIELLGGFEEPQVAELAPGIDLLSCLETEPDPSELLEELTASEERLLMEIDSFDSLLTRKAERMN